MSPQQSGDALPLTLADVLSFHTSCSEAMIRRMAIDPGLGQFSNFNPTMERERLADTARRPGGCVTLAYTRDDVVVGYVSVAPPDPRDRWANVKGVFEALAIDVSRSWRSRHVGRELMLRAFADPIWERRIVFANAYAWHWDLEGTGLTKAAYAQALLKLVRPAGFLPFETDEPNIHWDEANLFLVRIGSEVDDSLYYSFQSRLFEYRL